jgi:Holliday junction resolvasome RuvABC ATP-dependent DNA helicase subunit
MDSQHNHSASLETSSSAAQPNTGIVIYGPQGCGKTTHAAALARHYGKTRIVDDWTPGGPVPDDTLVLTNVPHGRAISFLDAARAAGIRLPAALARALAADRRAA